MDIIVPTAHLPKGPLPVTAGAQPDGGVIAMKNVLDNIKPLIRRLSKLSDDCKMQIGLSKEYTGTLESAFGVEVTKRLFKIYEELLAGVVGFSNEAEGFLCEIFMRTIKLFGSAVKRAILLGDFQDLELRLDELKNQTVTLVKILKSGIKEGRVRSMNQSDLTESYERGTNQRDSNKENELVEKSVGRKDVQLNLSSPEQGVVKPITRPPRRLSEKRTNKKATLIATEATSQKAQPLKSSMSSESISAAGSDGVSPVRVLKATENSSITASSSSTGGEMKSIYNSNSGKGPKEVKFKESDSQTPSSSSLSSSSSSSFSQAHNQNMRKSTSVSSLHSNPNSPPIYFQQYSTGKSTEEEKVSKKRKSFGYSKRSNSHTSEKNRGKKEKWECKYCGNFNKSTCSECSWCSHIKTEESFPIILSI